jgi:hypothetical protein
MIEKMVLGIKPKNDEKLIGSLESKEGKLTFWLIKKSNAEYAIIARNDSGKIVRGINYEN